MENYKLNIAVRLYSGEFQIDKIKTNSGAQFYLLKLPAFLAGKIDEYIPWFENDVRKRNFTPNYK